MMTWLVVGLWFSLVGVLIGVAAHEIGRIKAAKRCMEIINLHGRGASAVIEAEFKLSELDEEPSPWQP